MTKLLFLLIVGISFMLSAQSRQTENSFQKEISKIVKLNYLLYLPLNYKEKDAWPLVVFLHGSGERGDNLQKVKVHGIPKLIDKGRDFEFIALSPQCPENEEWDIDALNALIDEVTANYKVDKDKITLTGLSMGGGGVWDLAIKYPDKFAGIAPVCGVMDRNNPAKAARLKNMPIWVFHGANDDVVTVNNSAKMVVALKAAGNDNVKFTIYPEANHDAWTATYNNEELYKWLVEQDRKNNQ